MPCVKFKKYAVKKIDNKVKNINPNNLNYYIYLSLLRASMLKFKYLKIIFILNSFSLSLNHKSPQ